MILIKQINKVPETSDFVLFHADDLLREGYHVQTEFLEYWTDIDSGHTFTDIDYWLEEIEEKEYIRNILEDFSNQAGGEVSTYKIEKYVEDFEKYFKY